jgi:hypothetical protein
MKTLVLSISFFVLAVSPFTCSSELSAIAGREEQEPTLQVTTTTQVEVEIDPIVMPKKP